MRKVALLFFLLSTSSCAFSQLIKDLPSLYVVDSSKLTSYTPAALAQSNIEAPRANDHSVAKPALLKDAKVSLEVGSSFSTFGSGRNMFTTYLSPSVAFNPSNKMQVLVGAYVAHNNANGFNNDKVVSVAEPVAGYTGATYFLTDRLNLFGNGLYGRGGYAVVPYGLNNDYKSISVGVTYKINTNTSISAQVQWSQGLPPYGSYLSNNPFSYYHNNFLNSATEPNFEK